MSELETLPPVRTAVDGPARVKALEKDKREQPEKSRRAKDTTSTDGPASDTVSLSAEAMQRSQDSRGNQESAILAREETKVRAHEASHKAAGGQFAGAVTYEYRTGPDGKSYVTGGEVQIDLSPGNTPEETISKMQIVIRAALAPADPSPQDRAVAAQAAAIMAEAQNRLAKGQAENAEPETRPQTPGNRETQQPVAEPGAPSTDTINSALSPGPLSTYV